MDTLRLGRSIRALRIRRSWRQADLAVASGVSRSAISRIELGAIRSTRLDSLEAACSALGADLDVRVRWHGEGLDRLLDQEHAGIVERVVELLRRAGWEAAVEATFDVHGERGSVDVLGWHLATRSLLIAEIKSVVADAQGTLMPLDRKERLGPAIGRNRGWDPEFVSRSSSCAMGRRIGDALLSLPGHSTSCSRRAGRHSGADCGRHPEQSLRSCFSRIPRRRAQDDVRPAGNGSIAHGRRGGVPSDRRKSAVNVRAMGAAGKGGRPSSCARAEVIRQFRRSCRA